MPALNDVVVKDAGGLATFLGTTCAVLVPTKTGLANSLMDAHAGVRDFLRRHGLHDYQQQDAGEGAKVHLRTWLVDTDGQVESTTSLYRPLTNGDPRLWISRLRQYANPQDVLGLLAWNGELYVVNSSRPDLLATASDPASPLGQLLAKIKGEGPAVAQAAVNSLVRLQERAFGGEDVATRPDADDASWWPSGALLPGVAEFISDVAARVAGTSGLTVYFLLGGAGNGKSFAARALAKRLNITLEADASGLARRTYETRCGGTDVILLNDATIAPGRDYRAQQAVALATDLGRWWQRAGERPVVAFCCVNRGIVVDELRAIIRDEEVGAVPRAVLEWLVRPDGPAFAGFTAAATQGEALIQGEHFHQHSVEDGGRPLRVFSLAVDTLSLMQPDVDGNAARGSVLMGKVLAKCETDAAERPALCPIRANVQQLVQDGAIARWNSLLSAAEISSGRLFSYRDLWGAIVLSILGPRVAEDASASAATIDHVDAWLEVAAGAPTASERLDALMRLSRFRLHNAIFRAPIPVGADAAAEFPPGTPFHVGLSLLDPSAWGSADSPALEAALQAISTGECPSAHVPADAIALQAVWSPFDAALEEALVDHVMSDKCPDVVRRRLVSWFGGYLARLACTASGNLGNAEALATWMACREACMHHPAPLPLVLHAPIKGLLFPAQPGTADHNILVPAFAARMEPVAAARDGQATMLVESISHASIALRVRGAANRLVLECMRAGTEHVVGQLALDFALVREALAWRSGRAGQTESSGFIDPRIERCRAATLASIPPEQRQLIALVDGKQVELRQ